MASFTALLCSVSDATLGYQKPAATSYGKSPQYSTQVPLLSDLSKKALGSGGSAYLQPRPCNHVLATMGKWGISPGQQNGAITLGFESAVGFRSDLR